jgi:PAS domain S-box-containing protein
MNSQLQKYKDQIKALKNELDEIKGRYHLFIQMCPDAVLTVGEGRIASANTEALKLHGVKNEKELIGKNIMDFIHPDYRDTVRERMKKLNQGKEVPLAEEKLIRMDGKVVDIEVIATPFMSYGKRFIKVIIRDITERKKAYQLLEERNIVLRELINHIRQEKNAIPIEHLSPKEADICNMIRQSFSNKKIAHLLKVSPLTVGTYRNRIRKKLGISRKVNLTVFLQKNHS